MPVDLIPLDDGTGVLLTASGVVTDEEYIAAMKEHLSNNELLQRLKYSLSDYSPAQKILVSADAIQRVAELCKKTAASHPEVIVAQVGESDLIFGLSRMFQAYIADLPWEIRLFRTRPEAEAWLRQKAFEKFGIQNLRFD